MKLKVGQKVCVSNVYSGGNFENGDVVTIGRIGCKDDPNCYGAISPHDGSFWYLEEDEVTPIITNADKIRAMSDDELAKWLAELCFCTDACPASTNEVEESIGYYCPQNCKEQALKWLQQPCNDD